MGPALSLVGSLMTWVLAAGPGPAQVPALEPAAAGPSGGGMVIPTPPPVQLEMRVVPAPVTPAQDPPARDPLRVERDGRPLTVKLGDPLVLEISAICHRDTVLFPPLLPAVGTFEIGSMLPGREVVEGVQRRVTWRWSLLPVHMGIEKIPAIEIPYRATSAAGVADEGSVSTAAMRIEIRGYLENEADPSLGAAPAPVDVIATNWALVWALTVGGALVFAALASWLILLALRQRFDALRPAPPPRPANEVALERLARIDAASGTELGGAERLAATIDALREYLGGRYKIDALEMTSRELIETLPTLDLKGVAPAGISTLLDDADLVKFARLQPAEGDARAQSPLVRKLIVDTWEPPQVDVVQVQRLEKASFRQRLFAGLVDGVLAATLGVLLMGFLWVVGAIAWGFLALVLVGLLLVIRDLFGRSPGKRLLRLKIAMRDEAQSPAPLSVRLKRNLLLTLWPLTIPLEWLILRQHPLSLRVGDIWADTEVVRAESS